MGTPKFSVTPQQAWALASGPAGAGTSQYFRRLNPDTDPLNQLSEYGTYAFSLNAWQSQLSDSLTDMKVQRIVLDLSGTESNLAVFKFFGFDFIVSETREAVGVGAVWGVSELASGGGSPEYLGDFLGRFDLTLGSARVDDTSGIFELEGSSPSYGPRFSQRATVVLDRAAFPGMRTVGEFTRSKADGQSTTNISAAPVLAVDTLGYSSLIVELRGIKPIGTTLLRIASYLGFAYRLL